MKLKRNPTEQDDFTTIEVIVKDYDKQLIGLLEYIRDKPNPGHHLVSLLTLI